MTWVRRRKERYAARVQKAMKPEMKPVTTSVPKRARAVHWLAPPSIEPREERTSSTDEDSDPEHGESERRTADQENRSHGPHKEREDREEGGGKVDGEEELANAS